MMSAVNQDAYGNPAWGQGPGGSTRATRGARPPPDTKAREASRSGTRRA